ncbi:MAG: hypothetical protein MRJ65_12595 [Candidatus Brocadiaceae bacterium]|nr:hypothetical protein [Candidatus Brocadiaceae bacterium]
MTDIFRARDDVIVRERRLSMGNYVVNKCIIAERKTTKDFVLSIIDGRLFTQASRLKKYAEIPLMIIEGANLYSTGYEMDP